MKGVFVVSQWAALAAIIDDLALIDECSETEEWADLVVYLSLR